MNDRKRTRISSRWPLLAVVSVAFVFSTGCGDDTAEYSLSGEVALGMGQFEEGELVLQNTVNDDVVTIDWSGDSFSFSFPQLLKDGEEYSVGVVESPPDWSCGPLENTSGTIEGNDVEDVIIECYNTNVD